MQNDIRYSIEILDIAMNIIDMMALDAKEYQTPSSIARQFNINRSRAFRILKTLERRGFVEYEPKNEGYRLGLKFLAISRNIRTRLSVRAEAEEILRKIAEETGDTSYLLISSGNSAVVVERFSGDNMLQLSAPIGTMMPFHVGAGPKVLLAFLPEEQREVIIEKLELERFTPHTITDKRAFRRLVEEIRLNGYSVDEQDFELGAYAFGAPVFDHNGHLVAGISITTPSARYSTERRKELINIVKQSAEQLSGKLGYHHQSLS
jgi:IclR family transcriptional regulator, KDG regulon repressor